MIAFAVYGIGRTCPEPYSWISPSIELLRGISLMIRACNERTRYTIVIILMISRPIKLAGYIRQPLTLHG